ncbi:MAG: hypothetical protein ACOC1O_04355 [bacterium]
MYIKGNYKIFSILFFILIFSLLTACANEMEDQGNDNGLIPGNTERVEDDILAYFPLNQGMFYDYAGEGMEYTAFTREVKYKEEPYFQVHDSNAGTTIASIYKIEESQLTIVNRQEEFYSDENIIEELIEDEEVSEIVLQKPLEVGNSWETGNRNSEIVAIEDELEVPAGIFYDIIKIKVENTDQDTFTTYKYYAKNIGLIMEENIGEDYRMRSKLQAFEKNKKN